MNPIVSKTDSDTLEKLVDHYTLRAVLGALAVICVKKAEHIRSNRRNNLTAKRWARDAQTVERAGRIAFN